ncbi:MAG: substrate-binding domain-containing protein [Actinomycetales bacterium]|nr:substrate-binding domain-containing protein [Actinomycetales bacterium]
MTQVPSAGNGVEWWLWDKASCAFAPTEDHPETWEPITLKQETPLTVGFAAQDTVNAVNITMNESMANSAAAAGFDLATADYKFPSTTDPITAAKSLIVREPAVVISNNQLDTLLDPVNKQYADACIPVVQVVTAAEGAVLFGPSNSGMGELEGQRLIDVASARGWTADDTTLITTLFSPAGPEVAKRATVCAETVKAAFPGIKEVEYDTKSTTSSDLQSNFTDILTANPDSKNILNCTVADLWAMANANALKIAGRQATSAVTGVNGGAEVLDAIQAGDTALVGTVDLGAASWGDYWIPLAQDIAAGKPVPAEVYAPISMLPEQLP